VVGIVLTIWGQHTKRKIKHGKERNLLVDESANLGPQQSNPAQRNSLFPSSFRRALISPNLPVSSTVGGSFSWPVNIVFAFRDDSFHPFVFREIEEGLALVFDITSKLDPRAGFQDAFEHAPTFKDGVTRKVASVMPKDVKDIVESRRRWLLLKPLQKLKTWYSICINGDNFTIENGRAQLSLETAVATAGNFASNARPFRDQRCGLLAESKTVIAR
jgi:hypothetical protein